MYRTARSLINTSNPLEYQECVALTQYLKILKMQGKVKQFTHISNETFTKSWMTKTRNTAMGVTSGIPDYVIVTNKKVLFLEMKRVKGGTVSPAQKEWIKDLRNAGAICEVCKGFNEAEKFIKLHI